MMDVKASQGASATGGIDSSVVVNADVLAGGLALQEDVLSIVGREVVTHFSGWLRFWQNRPRTHRNRLAAAKTGGWLRLAP